LILERFLPRPALVASLAPKSFDDARRLVALTPAGASAIEYRLDLAPVRLSPRALLELDPRPAIMTWRTVREGGKFAGGADEYRRAVQSAYDAGATVDVELDSGLLAETGFLPNRRRVVASRHGGAVSEDALRAYAGCNAGALKIVQKEPETVSEAIACLEKTRAISRERPVSIFAMGPRGILTRILGARFGAALTYGSVEAETGPGQIPLEDLLRLYRVDGATRPDRLLAVYGRDVSESLSPEIYNRLFQEHGRPWLYVPVSASRREDGAEAPLSRDLAALESLWHNLFGVSVTNPFKGDFGGVAQPDDETRRLGAANTLVRCRPDCFDFSAHNTDTAAVGEVLGRLPGSRVVVVGTGGAARAAVAAATAHGRIVGVAGRDGAKAQALARALGVAALDGVAGELADVWINATPLGSREGDPLPIPREILGGRPAVIDFVYCRSGETALVALARKAGCEIVDGLELLARQAAHQARLFGVSGASFEEIIAIVRRA
jgi:3-dehydroquinate dehydratase/shikimate dehydrogenase